MKSLPASIKYAAIISSILLIPFVTMELVNRRQFHEGFPIALFVLLWLLPVLFILVLTPIIRTVRAGDRIMAAPLSLSLRIVLLVVLSGLWVSAILDQMPCFLGLPGCD